MSTEENWIHDIKKQIIQALDTENFAGAEQWAGIGRKVQVELSNSNGKALHCSSCYQRFETKSALREHVRFKHKKSNQCNICSREFTTKRGLAAHLRKDRNSHKEKRQ